MHARTGGVNPLISVIIAVYNGSGTLTRCLESIVSQTYKNWELVLIDGGSNDGTQEIVKKFEKRIKFWVSEPDNGVYHAWNKALKHTCGDWICFLGTDDYFMGEDVLEKIVPLLKRSYPEYRVVYGQVAQVGKEGQLIRTLGAPWSKASRTIHLNMSLPHTGSFHHSSLFHEHGQFDESFKVAGDYEFLLRELLRRDAVFAEGITVVAMQIGGLSGSLESSLKTLNEVRRARKLHGISGIHPYYLWAYAKVAIRVAMVKLFGTKITMHLFDFLRMLTGREPYWTRL